jgi:BirA family biotin operon repressor/biotin-[acetyl-CoA-carboxylase] ligase
MDFDIIRLASCESTNDEALARALAGAPAGTVVWADEQSRGRGQKGRVWHAPAGENLTFSIVLRPAVAMAAVAPLTLAAGLGVEEAVRGFGVATSLKWPNDILCGSKKLAGVLCETRSQGAHVSALILGIGLNVNTVSFPEELAARATSLRNETGRTFAIEEVLWRLLPSLEMWLDRFDLGGVSALAEAFWLRAYRGPLRLHAPDGPVEARATGLAPDGALRVETSAGQELIVHSGDIFAF